jgi:hypothetical protein
MLTATVGMTLYPLKSLEFIFDAPLKNKQGGRMAAALFDKIIDDSETLTTFIRQSYTSIRRSSSSFR